MDKEFKYDAFISYRHSELDKFVAENLHKSLETYDLPKSVKEKFGLEGKTIRRIFRDRDELPLSSNLEDPIVDALNNSKYLIVICSPRLKESLWCKKEIETFKKVRGRKNIFCVLIEGEPEDSFPEEVLYDEKTVTDEKGKKKKVKELIEPLAADVRGKNKKEVLKLIKEEKLRLIAPMYNLDYDDLKQRHKLRRMKKMIFTSTIISSICVLFAIYSLLMFLKISSQQKILKNHQALSLADKAQNYLNKDSRTNAIKNSYYALTEFKGVDMPYTSEAEYELSEALGVYNLGASYKAMSELKTKGVIDFVKVSSDRKYVVTIDESEDISIFNIDNMKKIKSYNDINILSFVDEQFTFIGNDKLAYVSKKGDVVVLSLKNGKKIKTIKKNNYSYRSLSSDNGGNYLVINDSPSIYLYDVKDFKEVGSYKVDSKDEIEYQMRFTSDGKKLFIGSSLKTYDIHADINIKISVFNTNDLSLNNSFDIDANYIEELIEKGNSVIILANKSTGVNDYNTLLVSYNYADKNINYTKSIKDMWTSKIVGSLYEEANNFAVVSGNLISIYNASNGEYIKSYSVSGDVIGIFASKTADNYLAFSTDGTANFLNLKEKEVFIVNGLFQLNLDKYTYALKSDYGYILVPKYENRLISYEADKSKNLKEIDIKLDYVKDQGIKLNEYDKVKKEFNIKKKNLVKHIIYTKDKKTLIVSYTDNTVAFYNVKDKKYLNMIKDVDVVEHYFGKDKKGRMYVGNTSNTYIISKDFEKVGHIQNMAKLDKKKNQIIVSDSDKYYTLPIYYLNDLLKEAKTYLNK